MAYLQQGHQALGKWVPKQMDSTGGYKSGQAITGGAPRQRWMSEVEGDYTSREAITGGVGARQYSGRRRGQERRGEGMRGEERRREATRGEDRRVWGEEVAEVENQSTFHSGSGTNTRHVNTTR